MAAGSRFEIRLYDAGTHSVRSAVVVADDIDAARAEVAGAHRDAVILSAQPWQDEGGWRAAGGATAAISRWMSRWRAGPQFEVAWWCHELRTLLLAGMTVVEAIETMRASSGSAAAGAAERLRLEVQQRILVALQQGQALSQALSPADGFPPVLVAGVRAGERSGALVDALDEYLRYEEMLGRLRRQVVSASIYPLLVVGLGLLISGFLLLFVVPRFSKMYADLRGTTSVSTRILIALSKTLSEHPLFVAAAIAVVLAAVVEAWRRGWGARALSWLIEHVDWLQRRAEEFRRAKLYHSLALMFRGGYTVDDALAQCRALSLGGGMDRRVDQARAALMRGQPVATAFQDAGLADIVGMRLLRVGERSGNFDRVLQTVADRHALNFSTFVERATKIVEPALLLLVATIVGGIVILMYMPIFDIAGSIR